jgi:outer membrane protein TolC
MSRSSPLRARWLAIWLAAGLSSVAHAAPALSLDDALTLAQEHSRQLVAQDAAATAAREMAAAAAQRPDPTLKAGIANLPVDGADRFSLSRDFMTMRSVGVMQEFTREDKRRARSARFEREAEVAQAQRRLALAALRRDTALAWLDRHYQERFVALLQQQRDEAALQIDAAEAAYRGGRGAQADVFAARAAVAQIDDRIRQADGQRAAATTRLARWIGPGAAGRPLGAAPALDASHVARMADGELESRIARHPEVELMARQEGVARAEADIARSNRHPDWSVELMFSQRGSAYSNMVSVNLALPLPWDRANRQDRELAARSAAAEQVRALREDAERERLAEVRTWLQTWRSARERLAFYDATLIPLAAERMRAAVAAYRGGGGSLASVLDARRGEIDQRIERLRLDAEAAGLWARLEFLDLSQQESSR